MLQIEHKKYFDKWNEVKKELDSFLRLHRVKEDEVYWCSLGENIGDEESGKGDRHRRPIKKYYKCYIDKK